MSLLGRRLFVFLFPKALPPAVSSTPQFAIVFEVMSTSSDILVIIEHSDTSGYVIIWYNLLKCIYVVATFFLPFFTY